MNVYYGVPGLEKKPWEEKNIRVAANSCAEKNTMVSEMASDMPLKHFPQHGLEMVRRKTNQPKI